MRTLKRICIKTKNIKDSEGTTCGVVRAKEYITSEEKDGKVCVFTCHWIWMDVKLFAGEQVFTK